MLALKPALHFLPALFLLPSLLSPRVSFLAKLFIYLLPSLYTPRPSLRMRNSVRGSFTRSFARSLALHRNGGELFSLSLWEGKQICGI